MKNENNFNKKRNGNWGGKWTEKKLIAFEKYVKAYLVIMNKYPYWKTIYFDGFAGSGEREKIEIDSNSLFSISNEARLEELQVYQGAAERIINLDSKNSFDYYYFIEKNAEKSQKLEDKLKSLEHSKNKTIIIRNDDSNVQLEKLANSLKSPEYAALIFLDPFGMQLNWETIEKFKGTRSDIWILIPSGVIINRLLDKKQKLTHIEKLKQFFGLNEGEILDAFYPQNNQQSIFENGSTHREKVSNPINKIIEIYVENLSSIFSEVTKRPLILKNSSNSPIFHLVFASNSKSARKIAADIIKKEA